MDKGSKPAGNTTVTQSNTPWGGQVPFLVGGGNGVNPSNTLYTKAYQAGNTPLQYFPGQTYASPTSQQEQAVNLQSQLATNNPVSQAATGGVLPYLNGSMLSAGNPYFGNLVGQLGQDIAPSIDSHFAANGRYGSGANANAFADSLTREAGRLAYQNYSDQSTNQLKALLLSPQISASNFGDIGQLASAGAQQQAFNQLPISEAVNRFQFGQDAPFIQAQRMAELLGQPIPGGGTTTQPYFTNPVGSALGTAGGLLSLYGLGNNITGGGLNSGVSSLWGSLFGGGGIGGAGGSGLSQGALDSLGTDALSNIGAGAAGL